MTQPDSGIRNEAQTSTSWQCQACGNRNPFGHTSCVSCGRRASAPGTVQVGSLEIDPHDWKTLQFAPLWVFSAIAEADGVVDEKETATLAAIIQAAPHIENFFVRELVASVTRNIEEIWAEYVEDSRAIDSALEDVRATLSKYLGNDEAKAFKMFLLFVGSQIAQASGGGFLGLGDKASKEEKAVWTFIAMKLGITLEDL